MDNDLLPMITLEQERIQDIRQLRRKCRRYERIREEFRPDKQTGYEGHTIPLSMRIMYVLYKLQLNILIKRFEQDYGYTP